MEKELQELRDRLSKVEEWKRRRQEIEEELAKVWIEDGQELAPPAYVEEEGERRAESDMDQENVGMLVGSRSSSLWKHYGLPECVRSACRPLE